MGIKKKKRKIMDLMEERKTKLILPKFSHLIFLNEVVYSDLFELKAPLKLFTKGLTPSTVLCGSMYVLPCILN
jgi:hypothetical protein